VSTSKAEFLIEILKGEKVADVSYTAIWERELEKIAKGEVSSISYFLNDVKRYVIEFVEKIKKSNVEYHKREQGKELKKVEYVKMRERKRSGKRGYIFSIKK
jgi:DNA topoisomerase-3